ncbi:hypothetical protein F8388_020661 [Cannabis sativa]|uniref:Pentatricopeptide repeat-containing protein n=1 Tax=Cannabis sativa TaxID=3483 RepID=A0A7J6F2K4_CANSA|nr:hypothetical protein F8388_020661 [Cannabis sativa]
MLKSNVNVSEYSLNVVVAGLCWNGEIKRSRELVQAMVSRGITLSTITLNMVLDACSKRSNFVELDLILGLMEKEAYTRCCQTTNTGICCATGQRERRGDAQGAHLGRERGEALHMSRPPERKKEKGKDRGEFAGGGWEFCRCYRGERERERRDKEEKS